MAYTLGRFQPATLGLDARFLSILINAQGNFIAYGVILRRSEQLTPFGWNDRLDGEFKTAATMIPNQVVKSRGSLLDCCIQSVGNRLSEKGNDIKKRGLSAGIRPNQQLERTQGLADVP